MRVMRQHPADMTQRIGGLAPVAVGIVGIGRNDGSYNPFSRAAANMRNKAFVKLLHVVQSL